MKKIPLPLLNYYLYSLLLVATPFLMLQNFLQDAVGRASRASFALGELRVPYVVVLAVLAVAGLLYLLRKKLNKRGLTVLGIVVVFFAAGQLTSDYYFNSRFYDLQHNWHYIAYGIYAYIAFRRFTLKPKPIHVLLRTIFLSAIAISVFDEIIQIFISSRVFDLSDVAKDLWGCMAGCIFVFFLLEQGRHFPEHRFSQKRIRDYVRHPFALLCTQIVWSYVFLWVSSQLTDASYVGPLAGISILLFLVIMLLVHLSRKRTGRWIIISLMSGLVVLAGLMAFTGPGKIRSNASGMLSYNGIPLPYFDYMIYPDGGFRAVNKKTSFGLRDKQKINSLQADILLLGTGPKGDGGRGWNDNLETELGYNVQTQQIFQIIKQPNRQAYQTYNRLRAEGKRVLFIIHDP